MEKFYVSFMYNCVIITMTCVYMLIILFASETAAVLWHDFTSYNHLQFIHKTYYIAFGTNFGGRRLWWMQQFTTNLSICFICYNYSAAAALLSKAANPPIFYIKIFLSHNPPVCVLCYITMTCVYMLIILFASETAAVLWHDFTSYNHLQFIHKTYYIAFGTNFGGRRLWWMQQFTTNLSICFICHNFYAAAL